VTCGTGPPGKRERSKYGESERRLNGAMSVDRGRDDWPAKTKRVATGKGKGTSEHNACEKTTGYYQANILEGPIKGSKGKKKKKTGMNIKIIPADKPFETAPGLQKKVIRDGPKSVVNEEQLILRQ